jgi:hypothetical protein
MICGDDTGLCKRVSDKDGSVVVRWGEQASGAAVHRLCVRGALIGCGRGNGSVDLFTLLPDSSAEPARTHTYELEGRVEIAGLGFAGDDRLVIADAAGSIEVVRTASPDDASGAEQKHSKRTKPPPAHGPADKRVGEAHAHAHTAQLRVDPAGMLAATGGREHELRVWDLSRMEVAWKARNVRAADQHQRAAQRTNRAAHQLHSAPTRTGH